MFLDIRCVGNIVSNLVVILAFVRFLTTKGRLKKLKKVASKLNKNLLATSE